MRDDLSTSGGNVAGAASPPSGAITSAASTSTSVSGLARVEAHGEEASRGDSPHRSGTRALVAFYVLAYAITWGWGFTLVAGGEVVRRGQGWPTHFPALLGPAIAAVIVTAWISDRPGLANLGRRMLRWRFPLRWWGAALSPLLFLGIALAVAAAVGHAPRLGSFGRYSGLSALGLVWVALMVTVVNGYGEEVGWRGVALPVIQRRVGARQAAVIVAALWALWHLPFFFLQASYRSFGAPTLVGFVIGIAAGSIVLTWLYNGAGASILAAVVWHAAYNMAAAHVGRLGHDRRGRQHAGDRAGRRAPAPRLSCRAIRRGAGARAPSTAGEAGVGAGYLGTS